MIKRVLFILMALSIAIMPMTAQSKSEIKQVKKQAKTFAKERTKEGYQSLYPDDLVYLFEQYLYKARFGHVQIIGMYEGGNSKSLGQKGALNNGLNEYATLMSSDIEGTIKSSESHVNGKELDEIMAAFRNNVSHTVKGELQECVILYRELRKKKYDFIIYCLIDHEAAHAAKMLAMNLALEELGLAQKYGDMVPDWID